MRHRRDQEEFCLCMLIYSEQTEEEPNVEFKPVIHLTEQVETKTLEEDEDVLFKMLVATAFCSLFPGWRVTS